MHGFTQGFYTVLELIKSNAPDIFMLKEHWLTPDNMLKFDQTFHDYTCFGDSAMVNTVYSGVLRGRPIGGVVTLYKKKSLISYATTIASNDRYVIIRVTDWVLVNIYLPRVGTTERWTISLNTLNEILS